MWLAVRQEDGRVGDGGGKDTKKGKTWKRDTDIGWKDNSRETGTKTREEKGGTDHRSTQGQVGRGHVDNKRVHGNPSDYRASLITSCLCAIRSQSCAWGVTGHRVQRTLTNWLHYRAAELRSVCPSSIRLVGAHERQADQPTWGFGKAVCQTQKLVGQCDGIPDKLIAGIKGHLQLLVDLLIVIKPFSVKAGLQEWHRHSGLLQATQMPQHDLQVQRSIRLKSYCRFVQFHHVIF